MLTKHRKTFGVFMPPFHHPDQNPTWALQRDLEMVEWLDHLGFDEAWFGEHHNGGWELISSPEIFIAAASQRTTRIKLGTGVTSLPYHHPYLVAERMVMLDHLTRGRVIFGAGPGSLAFDAHVMGLDYQENRRKTAESLEAITRLLREDEPLNIKTDWFEMRDAQLHLKPFTNPCFEIVTAGSSSPSGPLIAGKLGVSLLTMGAGSPAGFEALRGMWDIVESQAEKFGQPADRNGWRLVSFVHLADTESQAREDVRFGLHHVLEYLKATTPLAKVLTADLNLDASIDELNASGMMIIGTPDMLVDHLDRFEKQTGGYGGFLSFGVELADREATRHSHELVMRDVVPKIQGTSDRQIRSFERMIGLNPNWSDEVERAQDKARSSWTNRER